MEKAHAVNGSKPVGFRRGLCVVIKQQDCTLGCCIYSEASPEKCSFVVFLSCSLSGAGSGTVHGHSSCLGRAQTSSMCFFFRNSRLLRLIGSQHRPVSRKVVGGKPQRPELQQPLPALIKSKPNIRGHCWLYRTRAAVQPYYRAVLLRVHARGCILF